MKTINVLGVSNSIYLNEINGYFTVGYFDEPLISIHDYDSGALIHTIKTKYCSSANGVLDGNEKYIVVLNEAKEIVIYDAKNFEEITKFKIENCGAVNTIKLLDSIVVVTANRAIGNVENKRDCFIFDINSNSKKSFDSGIYLKKSFILDKKLYLLGNEKNDSYSLKVLDLISDQLNILGNFESSIYEMVVFEENSNEKNRVFLYSESNEETSSNCIDIHSSSSFNKVNNDDKNKIVGGFINHNEVIQLEFIDSSKKYIISNTSQTLKFDVVTKATACNEKYFCFGVDKSVAFLEL